MAYAFNFHGGILKLEDDGKMEGLVEALREELDSEAPQILEKYGVEKRGDFRVLKFIPPTEIVVMGDEGEKQALLRGGKTIFYADLSPHPVLIILNHYFACEVSTKPDESEKSISAEIKKISLIPSSVSITVGWWGIDVPIVDDNAKVSLCYLAQEILQQVGLVSITYPPAGRWGKWVAGLVEKVVDVVSAGRRNGKLKVDAWVVQDPVKRIALKGAAGGIVSFSTPIITIFPSNPPLYVFFELVFEVVPNKRSKHSYLSPASILISFRFMLREESSNTLLATTEWVHRYLYDVNDKAVLEAVREDDIIDSINSLILSVWGVSK